MTRLSGRHVKPWGASHRVPGGGHGSALTTALLLLLGAAVVPGALTGAATEDGAIRFSGGSTDAGRLEIYHSGRWGTVCAQAPWSAATAEVACRQLGFGLSTGVMRMPAQDDDGGAPVWLSGVACSGEESQLSECEHSGWSDGEGMAAAQSCSGQDDVGVRCLACVRGETCGRYRKPVSFGGVVKRPEEVMEVARAARRGGGPLRLECTDVPTGVEGVECVARGYTSASAHECAAAAAPAASGANASAAAELIAAVLGAPWGAASKGAYVYKAELEDDYRRAAERLRLHLSRHPEDGVLLHCLLSRGTLRWNAAGLHGSQLRASLAPADHAIGLLKQLYLSPREQVVADLDWNSGRSAEGITDPGTRRLAEELIRDGVVEIDDYGLDIAALNATIEAAFESIDPALTSVAYSSAAGGEISSMATRIPLGALKPLIANSTINQVVRAYLGPDAVLDGHKVVRLLGQTRGEDFIAGLWHNDRAGNRLKLFVRLHDVDPDPKAGGHPTMVARGSHDLLYYSIEDYKNSRFTDSFVRAEYPVASLGGKMGSGFIFDTNSLHKGVPEGRLARTTVVLEYHRSPKCPAIQSLKLPIPCPSGDQHIVSVAETIGEEREDAAAFDAPGPGAGTGAGEGNCSASEQQQAKWDDSSYALSSSCVQWLPLSQAVGGDGGGGSALLAPPLEADGTSRWPAGVARLVQNTSEPRLENQIQASSEDPAHAVAGDHRPELLVAVVASECATRWRLYSYDVMPFDGNTYWMGAPKRGLCARGTRLGYVPFSGEDAGGCVVDGLPVVFGDFDMLLAWHTDTAAVASDTADAEQEGDDGLSARQAALSARFRETVRQHITDADRLEFEEVTAHSLGALVDAVAGGSAALIEEVLSAARFIPHELNEHGLHLLRSLLAEKLIDAKRRAVRHSIPELEQAWVSDGYLRLDFDDYISRSRGTGNDHLEELLRMVSAAPRPTIEPMRFVERRVVHTAGDAQYSLHQDTFHQVVKLWVYPANLSAADGALQFVPGSHRNSAGRLRWLYSRTRHNSPSVIREPSLRLDDDGTAAADAAPILQSFGLAPAISVLPLPGVRQTLVVADTNGLHCRGRAPPGTVRAALRPMGGENDGGVRRSNPFAL